MATTPKVLLKRSSIAGKVPLASDLQYGELAINFTDGKIYYKDASNNIAAFVDSARVQAIADNVSALASSQLDSAEVTSLVDSNYVNARLDRSLFLDSAEAIQLIDSAYVTARVDPSVLLDSAEIKQFIDSDWVQSKITVAFINSLAGVDAETLGGLPPNYYNNWDNIYNQPHIFDSAEVAQIASNTSMDSAEVIQLIDSAYVQARQLDSAATATTALNAIKLNNQSGNYYLDWTNTTNKPVILDTVDVSNIITQDVDKAFVDALNINANRLQGYSAQNFFDAIDSAIAIGNAALDSAEAIALIDSAYVNARVDRNLFLDSAEVISLIDSAYVNARLDTTSFLDSAEAIALIDSAHIRARQITYNTSDFTDSDWVNARIDSAINALIDGAPGALDTLNELAAALNDDSNAYNTLLSQIAALPDSAEVQLITQTQVDSAYVQLRQNYDYGSLINVPAGLLDSNAMEAIVDSAYVRVRQDYAYSSLTGVPTALSQFTNDTNYLDSTTVTGVVDQSYVISLINNNYLDSAETTQLIDSDYIETRVKRLIGDITVRGDLVPETNGQYSLGTLDNRWSDLFVGGNSIYLGRIILTESDGKLAVKDSNGLLIAQISLDGNTTDDLAEGSLNLYYTDTRVREAISATTGVAGYDSATGVFSIPSTTDHVTEGDNLYYTTARADSDFDTRLTTKTTTDVAEGDNLYYTTVRADSDFDVRLATKTTDNVAEGSNLYYTTARADSDFDARLATKTTTDLAEGDNLYYTKSRVDSDIVAAFIDDANSVNVTINNYVEDKVDSAYVLARVLEAPFLDSADAIALIDSAYVQLRQDYSYTSLINVPDLFDSNDATILVDSAYVQLRQDYSYTSLTNVPDLFDSNDAIILVDSGYVQLRQDYAYSSLTGAPTNVSAFANDANYIAASDSALLASLTTTGNIIVGGNLQVTGTTTTINTQDLNVTDNMIYMNAGESSGSPIASIDVGWAANVNDNGTYTHVGLFRDATDDTFKVFGQYAPEPNASAEINTGHASFELAPFAAKTLSGEYLGFDSDLATKTTDDVTEGSNLYYTTARHDSDTLVQVDAAYVQARQTHYLDSALAQQLIDASYIQSNQSNIDSALVQQLIDSNYINGFVKVVSDTTPQLGGHLDVNGKDIYSTSGNVTVQAAGYLHLGGGGGFGNHSVVMYDTYQFPNYRPKVGQYLTAGPSVNRLLEWDSVPFLDSAAIQGIINASYIQANQSNIDSNLVIQLIDSGYVQLRQDYAYSSLTGTPTSLSEFINDTNYLDSTTVQGVIDAAYVQANQTTYSTSDFTDSAYVTGLPVSTFTNDANYLDSITVQGVINQAYVQSNQITYNTSDFTDSAYVTGLPVSTFTNDAGYLTSTTVKTVIDSTYIATAIQTDSNITVTITNNITSTIDSAYVLERVADAPFLDSYYTIALIDSAYVQARTPQIDLSAVDQDIIPATNATYDLGDSNNRWKDLWLSGSSLILGDLKLQVTDGRVKFVDRITGNEVSVTASNVPTNLVDSAVVQNAINLSLPTFGNDYVDSATVLDIINSAGLDSDLVIRLVDSAYIQLRDRFQDSSLVTTTVDSAYVQIRVPESYLATIIDSAYVLARSPSGVDSAGITSLIDSAYINDRIEIVNDTTPQLGGDLDVNGKQIVSNSGNIAILSANYLHLGGGGGYADHKVGISDTYFFPAYAPSKGQVLTAGPSIFNYLEWDSVNYLDSAAVIQLITANAGTGNLDSALVTQLIDSAYIQARQLDSASIATNAYRFGNQTPSYYLDYNNFANTPIIPTVDKATIDALNIDADTLDGYNSTYYLNYNNLSNLPNVLDSQEVRGIFTQEVEAQALVGGKFIEFIYDANQIEYNVTIGTKTTAHRYYGTGSTSGYIIRDQEGPFLQFVPGNTYRFLQSHPSNAGHPIKFYYDAARTTEYTAGVTQNGTPGTSGAYTEIVISDTTPSVLHYQCQYHGYMGNAVFTQTRNLTGFNTDNLSEGSTNLYFTEQRVRNVIDSAYVIARQIQGLDSALADGFLMTQAEVLTLIDSAYVQLRQSSVGTGGLDSALVTQLIDSAYIQSRQITGGGTVDSATTIALIQATVDSAYVAAREALAGGGASVAFKTIAVNTQDNIVASSAIDTLTFEAGNNITIQTDATTKTVTINSTATSTGGGVGAVTITKYVYTSDSNQSIFTGADDNGNTLSYDPLDTQVNVYLNGILLVDSDDFTLSDSATITLLSPAIFNDIVQIIKYTPSAGGGSGTGVDSAATLALIDSNYIQSRVGPIASGTLEINKYYYYATASQTVFTGADTFGNILNVDTDNIEVYLNGILLVDTQDYNATSSTITLSDAADSGWSVSIIETIGRVNTNQALNETIYEFDADSGQTVFSGVDRDGLKTLKMDKGVVSVYLNGILLSETNDYTKNNTTLTLLDAADSGDFIAIKVTKGAVVSGLNTDQYTFTNKTGTTLTGGGLGFTGNVQIFKNGSILKQSEFAVSNGDTITLATAAVPSDTYIVQTFNPTDTIGKSYDFIADSGQTVFTGDDRRGNNLYYQRDGLIVYLNGIALVDSADYVTTNQHTITFNEAVALNDEVKIYTYVPADLSSIATPLSLTKYEFTASSGQSIFNGSDDNGNTLSYDSDKVNIFLNGLLLRTEDYTLTNGVSVSLVVAADSGDNLTVEKITGNNIGLTRTEVEALIETNKGYDHNWTEQVTSTTVTSGSRVIVDCSSSAVNITLPATPTFGDEIRIIDGTGNASTNNITLLRNGNNIQGSADNLIIDIDRAAIGLVYYNATQGWILIEN